MSLLFLLSIFGFYPYTAFLKTPVRAYSPNCEEFSQDVTFEESDALGIWHLIHYRAATVNGTGTPHCLEFSVVGEEDRDILKDNVGMYVDGLNWDHISLRMTIPCQELPYKKKRYYFLEKIQGNGAYRTILLPFTANYSASRLSRYALRLKMVEGKYLAMMDCHDRYVFALGKQFPTGTETERRLARMVEAYWNS